MQFIPYSLYPTFIRPFLFLLDAETAHGVIINSAKFCSKKPLLNLFKQEVSYSPVKVMGLEFKNPVGLAAGLDKNCEAIDFFGALGFGHIEVGTVTPKPQDGNPKPRMFRIRSCQGIINRMGFNNKGVDYLVENLKKRTYKGVLGVSIGKNETTPLENAVDDYLICMDKVYEYADYIAVNISCPNTPDLTKLQAREPLEKLIKTLKEEQSKLQVQYNKYVPLVVKIGPDLTDDMIATVCQLCVELKVDGITCTNTTTRRDVIHGMEHSGEWGGLSGEPLRVIANNTLAKVNENLKGAIPIIGVGGVSNVISAREKINNGASLVQLYSSLVYRGPNVVKNIVNHI
ncbi:MAG: quinone-dependent dihydroorotate dehydrogenase [Aeromonadales bacterium]|nr:quinone-dependent dihydroorotate dehydrogenase [Aeromonadales bacterium]